MHRSAIGNAMAVVDDDHNKAASSHFASSFCFFPAISNISGFV
jgi:hypothetical protein